MTIKQLSVFLENKSGRINEVTKALGEQGINMHAFSMAETTDFGILRLIVSDVDKAVEVLRAKDIAEQQIFIEYMYAFAQGDRANIVIRPSNLSECLKQLSEEDCHILGGQQL